MKRRRPVKFGNSQVVCIHREFLSQNVLDQAFFSMVARANLRSNYKQFCENNHVDLYFPKKPLALVFFKFEDLLDDLGAFYRRIGKLKKICERSVHFQKNRLWVCLNYQEKMTGLTEAQKTLILELELYCEKQGFKVLLFKNRMFAKFVHDLVCDLLPFS